MAVLDEEGNLLQRLQPGQPTSFETEALPAQGSSLMVWLEPGTCTGTSSLTLAEVKPSWGRARQTVVTGHEYTNPPAGFTASFSIPAETHLLLESFMAPCDAALEVRRSGTGELLWHWPYDTSFFRAAWTPALSGDMDVGFASTPGCTGFPRSFAVRRMYTPLPPGAPASLHLPGQRPLTAAASARRGAFMDPEPTLLENWHRSYDPSIGRYLQPEPLASVNPTMAMTPTYAYAANNPARLVDPTGLYILAGKCDNWGKALEEARKKAGCDGSCPTCKLPCDICEYLEDNNWPIAFITPRPGGRGSGSDPERRMNYRGSNR